VLKSEYGDKNESLPVFFGRQFLLPGSKGPGVHAVRNKVYGNFDSAIAQGLLVMKRWDAHGIGLVDRPDPPLGNARCLPDGIDDNRLELLSFIANVQSVGRVMIY